MSPTSYQAAPPRVYGGVLYPILFLMQGGLGKKVIDWYKNGQYADFQAKTLKNPTALCFACKFGRHIFDNSKSPCLKTLSLSRIFCYFNAFPLWND
ncbi:hypothetical protein ACIRXL_01505 [Avibacterium paragallinarum]|uniref:hypothetical protein n=1 Tax=Avibacterium paragallinarum TaxID=728 RepID=UPI0039798020